MSVIEDTSGDQALGLKRFIPPMLTVLLALLMLAPVGSGVSSQIMPHLALISVFYWCSRRPLLMPYGACALAGICLDLWLGVPLGLNMLMLVAMRFTVLNQLKFYRGQSRIVHWAVFSLMSSVLFLLSWVISCLFKGTIAPIIPPMIQWAVTAFAYAPLALIMGRVRRWLL